MPVWHELKWESLESLREQLSLSLLYNVLIQNIYLPPECIPEFYQQTCHLPFFEVFTDKQFIYAMQYGKVLHCN